MIDEIVFVRGLPYRIVAVHGDAIGAIEAWQDGRFVVRLRGVDDETLGEVFHAVIDDAGDKGVAP